MAELNDPPESYQLDQVVYRHSGDERTLLDAPPGVGPVAASSLERDKLTRWDEWLSSQMAEPRDMSPSRCYLVREGEAALIYRAADKNRNRPSQFAHMLIGRTNELTLQRALGSWPWRWQGAIRPDSPVRRGEIEKVNRSLFTESDRGWHDLVNDENEPPGLYRLISFMLTDHPDVPSRVEDRKFAVITSEQGDLPVRMLSGLISKLRPEFLAGGFSTHEPKYADGMETLPRFVFATRVGYSSYQMSRMVLDLRDLDRDEHFKGEAEGLIESYKKSQAPDSGRDADEKGADKSVDDRADRICQPVNLVARTAADTLTDEEEGCSAGSGPTAEAAQEVVAGEEPADRSAGRVSPDKGGYVNGTGPAARLAAGPAPAGHSDYQGAAATSPRRHSRRDQVRSFGTDHLWPSEEKEFSWASRIKAPTRSHLTDPRSDTSLVIGDDKLVEKLGNLDRSNIDVLTDEFLARIDNSAQPIQYHPVQQALLAHRFYGDRLKAVGEESGPSINELYGALALFAFPPASSHTLDSAVVNSIFNETWMPAPLLFKILERVLPDKKAPEEWVQIIGRGRLADLKITLEEKSASRRPPAHQADKPSVVWLLVALSIMFLLVLALFLLGGLS